MSAAEDVKKSAELKQWLEDRIAELQEEIDRLKETLSIVDANLRASTFRPAIDMIAEEKEVPEVRELKRDKSGETIALAAVTSNKVSIEPKEGVELKSATPPFKSFLVGKILQGMKTKDEELVAEGKLSRGQVLSFAVKEDAGRISSLRIENYREKARLNELLNTVGWTFSRMLEK
ncbi:MAG TPA: hypothetical protein VEJ36_01320 [Nitrososphaerales archaeon]|nr:hypothetical protein [Nitrososphaerales archaeon]